MASSFLVAQRGILHLPLPDTLYTLLFPMLFSSVVLGMYILQFGAYFVLLLEHSPPDNQSVASFTWFICPLFALAASPLLIGHVLSAPLLVAALCASLPFAVLSSEHAPQIGQLIVLYI